MFFKNLVNAKNTIYFLIRKKTKKWQKWKEEKINYEMLELKDAKLAWSLDLQPTQGKKKG
jgi:hypothetical protein